jgi:23S rRNA pseudouridine2457 synthase
MTASVGLPTLHLIRVAVDLLGGKPALDLADLAPGEWRLANSTKSEHLVSILRDAPSPVA